MLLCDAYGSTCLPDCAVSAHSTQLRLAYSFPHPHFNRLRWPPHCSISHALTLVAHLDCNACISA